MKARFLGKIKYEQQHDVMEIGDCAIFSDGPWNGEFVARCPICHGWHTVPVARERGYNGPVWEWNETALTLSPSVKVTAIAVCHYNLTNGEWIIHDDSTAKPFTHEESP